MSSNVAQCCTYNNLDGYAVEYPQHKHSTWMVMPLTVFGITIKLDVYDVEYVRHEHST
jgi:hypothetical protein